MNWCRAAPEECPVLIALEAGAIDDLGGFEFVVKEETGMGYPTYEPVFGLWKSQREALLAIKSDVELALLVRGKHQQLSTLAVDVALAVGTKLTDEQEGKVLRAILSRVGDD